MTSVEEIEQIIKPFLLLKATFTIDNKVIKQGKLQLFCIKDFFCTFTLLGIEKENKKVIYELPYPFSIKCHTNSIEFDYTLESFCISNNAIKELTDKVKLNKTSKFFNKKVIANFS
jgi:hypothetical protein